MMKMKNKNWTPKFIALAVICLLIGVGIGLLGYHYFSKSELTLDDWQSTKIQPTKEMVEKIVLYENNKQQIINLKSQNGKGIASLLTRKLHELNLQSTCVFSEEDIREIKQNDRVMELIFKEPIDITISQWTEPEERYHIPVDERGYRILGNVETAIFILEDRQERGLEAHILVGHGVEGRIGYSCWAINIKEEGKPELDKTWIDGINRLIKSEDAESEVLFFPTLKEPATMHMEALLSDKPEELELVDGCLRVNNGYDNYLIVWPYGFSLTDIDNVTTVVDNTGKPIVSVGDKIEVSGGECAGCTDDDIAKISTQLPNDRCSGPYWIVGAEITKGD